MLAIIIPYFKILFLEEALQSLANQTDKRFNVYIGNDASPDDPLEIIAKFQEKFKIVYHRFETNLGGISLVQQWERCIDLSKDEKWLMILGDDDVLSSNCIENFYINNEEIMINKCNVVRFATIEIDGNSKIISKEYRHPKFEKATDSYLRKFKYLTRSSLSEYIFTRKVYKKFGFFNYPLAWNSDDRAWLDFSDNKPIFSINESIVYFRLSNYNISGKSDNKYLKNLSQIGFFKYLILNKFDYYTKHQKIVFLTRYENQIRNIRKLKYREWFFLMFYFLKYFNFKEIKKFLKRFLNTTLRRHGY